MVVKKHGSNKLKIVVTKKFGYFDTQKLAASTKNAIKRKTKNVTFTKTITTGRGSSFYGKFSFVKSSDASPIDVRAAIQQKLPDSKVIVKRM